MYKDIFLSPIRKDELETFIQKSVNKAIKEALASNNNEFTDSSGNLLTVNQAAEFLNLAKQTVYSMVSRGELPYMKRSKRLYFSSEDLLAYIRDGRRLTKAETKDEASNYVSIRGKEVRHA